jgi:hypothetical protein
MRPQPVARIVNGVHDSRHEKLMTATAQRARRRWTYADYCRIAPDRMRHELIDGGTT